MRYSRLIVVGFAATFLMAVAVSSASANRLSISNQNFRVTYRSLEFLESGGAFGTVRCPVTLEGSFHSGTIRKVERALIGHVSRASVSATCTGGSATVLNETLPWHVTYQGFKGTLPRITAVRLLLIGAAFKIHIRLGFEFFCLAKSEVNNPIFGEALVEPNGTGTITALAPDETHEVPLTGAGGAGCPATTGHFSAPVGDGTVTLLGNTTKITITLI